MSNYFRFAILFIRENKSWWRPQGALINSKRKLKCKRKFLSRERERKRRRPLSRQRRPKKKRLTQNHRLARLRLRKLLKPRNSFPVFFLYRQMLWEFIFYFETLGILPEV